MESGMDLVAQLARDRILGSGMQVRILPRLRTSMGGNYASLELTVDLAATGPDVVGSTPIEVTFVKVMSGEYLKTHFGADAGETPSGARDRHDRVIT